MVKEQKAVVGQTFLSAGMIGRQERTESNGGADILVCRDDRQTRMSAPRYLEKHGIAGKSLS
jgi:hypothetical protein